MPYGSFMAYNATGRVAWATVFVLLLRWRRVVPHRRAGRRQASLLLLGLIALGFVLRWATRRVIARQDRLRALGRRVIETPPVRWISGRYHLQLRWLGDRLDPRLSRGLSLTVIVVALTAAGWAVGAIVQDLLVGEELALLDAPGRALDGPAPHRCGAHGGQGRPRCRRPVRCRRHRAARRGGPAGPPAATGGGAGTARRGRCGRCRRAPAAPPAGDRGRHPPPRDRHGPDRGVGGHRHRRGGACAGLGRGARTAGAAALVVAVAGVAALVDGKTALSGALGGGAISALWALGLELQTRAGSAGPVAQLSGPGPSDV